MHWRGWSSSGGLSGWRFGRCLALPLVCTGYLSLATTYSLLNPIFEAPDETHHYMFVRYLVEQRSLPGQFASRADNPIKQEASQAPLYYILGALLVSGIDPGDAVPFEHNPHASIGKTSRQGNANTVVHCAPAEGFPYSGHALIVHVLRLYSIALGLGTVLATHGIAWRLTRDKGFAVCAAALVAFLPQFLFISSAINNDNLVTLLGSVGLLLCLDLARRPTNRHAALLGFTIGLAALSKLSGLTLIPLAVASVALAAWKQRSTRLLPLAALTLATASLVAGWWYVRNYLLYGDWLALNLHFQYMRTRGSDFTVDTILRELPGLKASFWGVFGWFNVNLDEPIYRFFDVFSALAALGLVRRLAARGSPLRVDASASVLVILQVLLVSLGLLRWILLTTGSQGRLLFPALSALAVLGLLGLASWAGRRYVWVGATAGICLFLISTWAIFVDIRMAYARPLPASEAEVLASARPLQADFGGMIALLGYRLPSERVRAGEELQVELYWRALAKMDKNYSIFIHVANDPLVRVAQIDSYPGRGSNPTTLWYPGDVVKDTFFIPFREDTPPGSYDLFVGIYDAKSGERLLVSGGKQWVVLHKVIVEAP